MPGRWRDWSLAGFARTSGESSMPEACWEEIAFHNAQSVPPRPSQSPPPSQLPCCRGLQLHDLQTGDLFQLSRCAWVDGACRVRELVLVSTGKAGSWEESNNVCGGQTGVSISSLPRPPLPYFRPLEILESSTSCARVLFSCLKLQQQFYSSILLGGLGVHSRCSNVMKSPDAHNWANRSKYLQLVPRRSLLDRIRSGCFD
jgi:hypothetical protein